MPTQSYIDNPTKNDQNLSPQFLSKKYWTTGSETGTAGQQTQAFQNKRESMFWSWRLFSAHAQPLQDMGLLLDIKHNKGIQRRLLVCLAFKVKY